jgi:hypothetical protein
MAQYFVYSNSKIYEDNDKDDTSLANWQGARVKGTVASD